MEQTPVTDQVLVLSPLLIWAWALFRSTQLYRHTLNREALFKETTGEQVYLRFLRMLSLATMCLAPIYFIAKTRCFLMGDYKGSSEGGILLWAATDAVIPAVLALLCWHGKSVADAAVRSKTIEKKNAILKAMIDAAGGFVWIKDAEGKYIFCDNTFCAFFFATPPEESVAGFTDVELLEAYRKRTGKEHTFGDLCMSTDTHCITQAKKCRYIEIGYIDGALVILDVIKTPLYNDQGCNTGTVGFAWDRSQDCEHVKKDIELFALEGRLVELCANVYWVKERLDECKWENPLA